MGISTEPLPTQTPGSISPVQLVARRGGLELARLRIAGGTATVGSAQENELWIDDSTVSRRHASLELHADGVWVRDLGSTNGIRYQGARVREVRVPVGAALLMGLVEIRIEPDGDDRATTFGDLRSVTPAMRAVLDQLRRVAPTDVTVLLEGESGTGKEVAARAIHQGSPRAHQRFEVVDCGTLPGELAGSELFGHVKGSFTGATRNHAGAFERASGGTLFLDEIGELPIELQPMLLRALERREVRRVGDPDYRPVDVRIVAATNKDLEADVAEGRFREDLLYRLAVVKLRLVPLRDRLDDLPLIARVLLEGLGDKAAGVSLSADTVAALRAHRWPGNVRELRNAIDRAVALSSALEPDVPRPDADGAPLDYPAARKQAIDAFEKDFLVHLLNRSDGKMSKAAKEASIDRVYLYKLLRKHGIKGR